MNGMTEFDFINTYRTDQIPMILNYHIFRITGI
mgnify:CR=1 FL=1